MTPPKVLMEKFFSDPDWKLVEEMLLAYINKLNDIDEIDVNASGADVKGELKARKRLYQDVMQFLQETKLVSRPVIPNKDTFR